MYPPNILITNYCNQDCSFCFTKEEMKNQSIDKEMSLENFKMVLRRMKRAGIDTVKLLTPNKKDSLLPGLCHGVV